jgi:uncharacterized protein
MADSRLALSTEGAIVAFKADSYDAPNRTGWTVLAVGPSSRVEDPRELGYDNSALPEPWALGEDAEHLMQLRLVNLSGHEIA